MLHCMLVDGIQVNPLFVVSNSFSHVTVVLCESKIHVLLVYCLKFLANSVNVYASCRRPHGPAVASDCLLCRCCLS